jgi:hypothetical protein
LRWSLIQRTYTTIPRIFVIVLVLWFSVLFATFGLLSPSNATVHAGMFACAPSVAGGMSLVMDMNRPRRSRVGRAARERSPFARPGVRTPMTRFLNTVVAPVIGLVAGVAATSWWTWQHAAPPRPGEVREQVAARVEQTQSAVELLEKLAGHMGSSVKAVRERRIPATADA